MARNKASQINVDGSDPSNYPDKRIRDNDGTNNGTPVNEAVYGDFHEFFAKIMRDSKTNFNGLPDNVANGYQLYDAIMSLAGKNDLIKVLTQENSTTLRIPIKLSALKVDETLIFKSSIDSTTNQIFIVGQENASKQLAINGAFKNGDYVRMINSTSIIYLVGLYDSQNVPNLETRLQALENLVSNTAGKLAIFQVGGGMFFWNKPANLIPAGFQEVVDWRGRMPVGYLSGDADFGIGGAVGGNGGSKTMELTIPHLAPHDHTYYHVTPNTGTYINVNMVGDEDHIGLDPYTTSKVGGDPAVSNPTKGKAFSLLNPYRTVLFIEWAT